MHRHMAIAHFGHDAKRQASQPRQELGGFRRMRARMQLAHDLVRAIGHARRRVGWIAAAATGIVLGGRLGFDVAKGCDVRHAAHGAVPDLRVNLPPPRWRAVEEVEVAVEDYLRAQRLPISSLQQGAQCEAVAVEPTHSVQRVAADARCATQRAGAETVA